jgi:hypothetical protein
VKWSVAGRITDVRERSLESSAGRLDIEGGNIAADSEVQDEVDKDVETEAAGDEGKIDCTIKALPCTAVDPAAGAQDVACCSEEATECGACLKALNSRQTTPSGLKVFA